MALLSIGICWAVATINAQLSPGQNRQSSPLITLAYHGPTGLPPGYSSPLVPPCGEVRGFGRGLNFPFPIAGDRRQQGWLAPIGCGLAFFGAEVVPSEPALSRARLRLNAGVRHKIGRAAEHDAGRHLRIGGDPFFIARKNYRSEIPNAAETLRFRKAGRELFLKRMPVGICIGGDPFLGPVKIIGGKFGKPQKRSAFGRPVGNYFYGDPKQQGQFADCAD